MKFTLKIFSALALATGLLSCGATKRLATNIETNLECKEICNRYATCYDPKYTVNACADTCAQKARSDGEFRRAADACNECMTANACVAVTASCGSQCSTVVPIPPATSSR